MPKKVFWELQSMYNFFEKLTVIIKEIYNTYH